MKNNKKQIRKENIYSENIEERELTLEELSMVTAASIKPAKKLRTNIKSKTGKTE